MEEFKLQDIKNLKDKDIYIEGEVKAKVLGTAVVNDRHFVYYVYDNIIYIEEKIERKYDDNYKAEFLEYIQSNNLWDFLFNKGIQYGIII